MRSPYSPPLSRFDTIGEARSPLRWHAALIFALVPALAMLLFQVGILSEVPRFWTIAAWEPLLVMSPVVAMCAASGFVIAEHCVRCSKRSLLAGAVVVGLLWTLACLIIGFVFTVLKQRLVLDPAGVTNASIQLAKFIVPLALILCTGLRLYGRKRGFLK